MRKFSIILLSALLVLGFAISARAEIGATAYTGVRYEEQQVFTYAYNNSGSEVTSNSIVILDTSATVGTTLGAYFTTDTGGDSNLILGVTADTIPAGSVGKICIRGPHRVWMNSHAGNSAGNQISTSTTAGKAKVTTGTTNKMGTAGVQLAEDTTYPGGAKDIWVCYLRYATQ